MFDISFAELMMVAIVGLLVIGPEKLPKMARTLGAYTGRLQRYVTQVKEEVNREVRFEELQALQQELKAGAEQVKSSIRDGELEVKETLAGLEKNEAPKPRLTTKKPTVKKVKTPVKNVAGKKAAAPKKAVLSKKSPRKARVKQTSDKA